MNVVECCCARRNDEQADFRKTWKDLYGLMPSEFSRTRRTLYTATAMTDIDRLNPSQQYKDLRHL